MKEQVRRRYEKDFFRTTEEIAYHITIRDSSMHPKDREKEQRIIDRRIDHLEDLRNKLGW